ncbi:MAG TPA: hypothetical protein VGH52_11670 [Gaiellaceae bacterium]|jgi:hypothetical protein
MPTAEVNVRSELEQVEHWRAQELRRAGYSEDAAATLASRHDIDLHRAVQLVERGCPADVALQILV